MPSDRPYYFPVWETERKPFRFTKYLSDEELFDITITCDRFFDTLQRYNIDLHDKMNAGEYKDFNLSLFYIGRALLATKRRCADELTERSLRRRGRDRETRCDEL